MYLQHAPYPAYEDIYLLKTYCKAAYKNKSKRYSMPRLLLVKFLKPHRQLLLRPYMGNSRKNHIQQRSSFG